MSHLKKRQRLSGVSAGFLADTVSIDVLANIFGYLDGPKDVMQKRRVCEKWKEAVKETIVPLADFLVNNVDKYNAMVVMTEAMPNLQQITIGDSGDRLKYNDGEDPDEKVAARTADWPTYDIEIISNFSKLRILKINYASFNGRYPFLFDSFPLLEKLSIEHCCHLMGPGYVIWIAHAERIGNFVDLADFSQLKVLVLPQTAVTGDIRDIGENDFSSLEELDLPHGVYGGIGYQIQRISDAPDVIRAVYLLKKQRPALEYLWYGVLSQDSPDRYEPDWFEDEVEDDDTTFYVRLVQAGPRIGYRWGTEYEDSCCEVNWLDPEPDRESSDYEEYIEELQKINSQVGLYSGFFQPPTEEEYNRLHDL